MKTDLKSNNNILFRNFDIFSKSEKSFKCFKSLIFQLAINGSLDFQKLSNGRIKKSLQALVKEQKAYLKKEHIAFAEQPDSIWPMVELGDICEFSPKKSEVKKLPKNQFISFVPMADLNAHNINFRIKNEKKLKNVYSGYTYFAEGDVLLARVTPCFENGKSGIARSLKNGIGFGSSEFFVYRVNKKIILSEILYYFISSNTFINNGKENMSGTGGLQRLTKDYAMKYKIPLPPLEVQKEIVALMKKCTLLEIQTKEKSQKQDEFSKSSMYFITQSKTKSELVHNWKRLKDNFKDILYSENGVKNFKSLLFQLMLCGSLDFQKLSNGRIKKSLQALVKEQKAYLKKEDIAFAEQPDSIWPMVELGDIAQIISGQSPKGRFYNTHNQGTPFYQGKKEFGDIYLGEPVKWTVSVTKTAKPNDILMSVRAPVGPVNITLQKICIGRGLASIRVKNNKINQMFLFYYLKKSQSKITGGGGSVFDSINQKSIKAIKIPFPPLEVQKEIVALMKVIENAEKQIQKEKALELQLSKSLSHLESYQKIV